jgi:PncC family amidohydrolase
VSAAHDATDRARLVSDALRRRGLTLAVAESCTGGLVADRLTDLAGASDVFVGGVVAYANAVKRAILGVDDAVIAEHGAVSEVVAAAMAVGVRDRLGATVGVATSGIAGPTGGSVDKPVGTLCVAVADAVGVCAETLHVIAADRRAFKIAAADAAYAAVLRRLDERLERLEHDGREG